MEMACRHKQWRQATLPLGLARIRQPGLAAAVERRVVRAFGSWVLSF